MTEPATHATPLAAAATGLIAALLGALLGIGGGLVIVPLLTLVFGVPLKRAIGTSLAGVVATASVAVATEAAIAPANLRLVEAGLLATGAVVGSAIGAWIVARIAVRHLTWALSALLIVAATRMAGLFDGGGPALALAEGPAGVALHLVAGLAAGVISALFGVGGGILAVPALAVLHPDWAFQACRATSLVMIIPTAIAGGLLHRKLRNLDGRLALGLVPGVLVGAVAGVFVANQVPGRPLEVVFAVLLVISAVRLARRAQVQAPR